MKNNIDAGKLVRGEIAALKPYISPHFEYKIKLDLNESPYDIPAEVKAEVWAKLENDRWQLYHDELEHPLKEAIAAWCGHTPDGVLIGNGSNELIFHGLLAVVPHGRAVLYPEPSFSLYRQNAVVLGANPVPFGLNAADFSVDSEKVIELANKENAVAVILCSPNNPTGGLVDNKTIAGIAAGVDCLVVVDEAYTQFASESAFELIAEYPNLMLLRTFSKAFGLASMRMGYSLSQPGIAQQIAKVQLPHHVNFFTQAAATTLLKNPELIARRVEQIKSERERLIIGMAALDGVNPYPSETNFILVEFARKTPQEIFDSLLGRGILVRNISNYPGLEKCLRITVGKPEENDVFLSALAEVL